MPPPTLSIVSPPISPISSKTLLAFAAIYVIWGTTYLAIAIGIQTIPPFISGALRFFLASGLLYAYLRMRDAQPFAGVNLKRGALCGVLMAGIGNGFVIWAEQGVPTGIAALIVASTPIAVLVLDWAFFGKQAPTRQALGGILLALFGVMLIVIHTGSLSGNAHPIHLAALIISVSAWSLGTLVQQHTPTTNRIMAFACVQMFWAALFQTALALLNNEWPLFDAAHVSWQSLAAVLYLVVFGSLVALGCYLWLLTHVSAQKVVTYALVNPVVALLLGSLILGEHISWFAVVSAGMVLTGVALVLFQKSATAMQAKVVEQ